MNRGSKAGAGLAAVISLALLGWWMIPRPPLLEGVGVSTAVYSRDYRLLRLTLAPDGAYRLPVSLGRIPRAMVRATLLKEDRYFYRHPGINPLSLLRAAWSTYVIRGRRLGASTITMQVARMRFGIRTATLPGKLLQLMRALQLERHFSKNEILAAYLTLAPYGGNVHGVGAASLIYFGHSADRLTPSEALLLSVIPQHPSLRAPRPSSPPHPGLERAWRELAGRWKEAYPEEEIDTGPERSRTAYSNTALPAHSLPATSLSATVRRGKMPFLAPHFVEAVLEQGKEGGEMVTTLDLEAQGLLERLARQYVEARTHQGIHNVSALLLNWRTMEVKAALGSVDYFSGAIQGQVNGTRAKRSPGSALKPFLYALALEQGVIHPRSLLADAPASWGVYQPENSDGTFQGPLSATEALVQSRNVPALRVAARLGRPDFYEFLQKAGVSGLRSRDHYGLALVLGGGEVTMEEMVRLYAMLGNGGVLRPLRTLVHQPGANPAGPGRSVLGREAAFMTLAMLEENPRPGEGLLRHWRRTPAPVHWKTGTSYGYRDAWAVGLFGRYVLAVWAGNFNGQGNPVFTGRGAAAPLFFRMVDALREREGLLAASFSPPPGVRRVKVCSVSGMFPGPFCPGTVETWFIPGKSPISTCSIHREILVDRASGLRACQGASGDTRREVFEFWPSDLSRILRKTGLPRREPPPFLPGCGVATSRGRAPRIASPVKGLTYFLRSNAPSRTAIPLEAVADAGVRRLYWFADETYLGKTPAGVPLFWKAEPGNYLLRAVDDQGRSDALALKVTLLD